MADFGFLKDYAKLYIYLVVLSILSVVPHELGHVVVARFFGYEVLGIFWSLTETSFVSVSGYYDPLVHGLVLFSGGFASCLVMFALSRVAKDRVLCTAAKSTALFSLSIGFLEALFTHFYNSQVFAQFILMNISLAVVYFYDYKRGKIPTQ